MAIDIPTGIVTYHPATDFEGDAAVVAAREDGIMDLGAPFYVRVAKETLTAVLDPDAMITVMIPTEDGQSPAAVSATTFVAAFAHMRPPDPWLRIAWFWVRQTQGHIRTMRQMQVV